MLVESYCKVEDPTVPIESSHEADEKRKALLISAGLHTVAGLLREERVETGRALFSELTGRELQVWQDFLPTKARLDGYTYDLPPDDAVQCIVDAKAIECFDDVQIWTPEGHTGGGRYLRSLSVAKEDLKNIDPMAVGVIKSNGHNHYFPIVRWGEALEPFRKVSRYVTRQKMIFRLLVAVTFVMPVLLSVALWWASTIVMPQSGGGSGPALGIPALVVSLASLVGLGFYGPSLYRDRVKNKN